VKPWALPNSTDTVSLLPLLADDVGAAVAVKSA